MSTLRETPKIEFETFAARRRAHASALHTLKDAIDALVAGSPSDKGADLLLEDLKAAHREAASVDLYASNDGPDPMVEATHNVVGNLRQFIEEQRDFEVLYGRPPSEQIEVSAENLAWMAGHILSDAELPTDKISRWTGFIQGVLAVRGRLSVSLERTATRPIFHRAYAKSGIARPASASMDGKHGGNQA